MPTTDPTPAPDTPMDAEFRNILSALDFPWHSTKEGREYFEGVLSALHRWHREQVEKAREEGFKDGTDEERGY